MGLRLFKLPLKRRALHDETHEQDLLFLRRIESFDSNSQKNTSIGQTNSGLGFYGVMRHGQSLENTRRQRSHGELAR